MTYTESYVEKMYGALGISEPNQLSIKKIAKQLGIVLYYWDDPSQAVFFNNRGHILMNRRKTPTQQQAVFFHELSHILLHTGVQHKLPKLFVEYQEHKANQFMYHAAMPTFMLDRLDSSLPITTIAKIFNVEYELALKRMQQYINNKHIMPNWNIQNDIPTNEIHII